MKQLVFALAGIGLILSSIHCSETRPPFNKPARFIEKEEGPMKISDGQIYRFGYLEVPENRKVSHSNRIQLPVYIFKSRNPTPKADPIVYTVGGPGSSTMPSAQYMKVYEYLDDRDFILLEQRGNYYAKPHLGCPEWAEAVYKSSLPSTEPTQVDSVKRQAVQACRDRLTQEGIDLNGYNTNESAADIADLIKLLEVDQYNLLTISYSTKIAQVLLRDYPAGIRSVVMDSPLPLEVSYDEESNRNLLAGLDQILSDCQAIPSCQRAYPRIHQRFYSYLEQLTANPQEILVKNPDTQEEERFLLQGKDIVILLSGLSTPDVPMLPFHIQQLLAGDYSLVRSLLASQLKGPSSGRGVGMRLSVWCAEEYPFASQKKIAEETQMYPGIIGLSPAVYDSCICNTWKVNKALPRDNMAIQSKVPILLISGEYDPITPSKWAAEMKTNLPNSHHLIFKGWKHTATTYWNNLCAMQSANAFFNNPQAKPHLDCFEKIKKPEFQLK